MATITNGTVNTVDCGPPCRATITPPGESPISFPDIDDDPPEHNCTRLKYAHDNGKKVDVVYTPGTPPTVGSVIVLP